MVRYDPLSPPKPADWLDMDETERIELVEAFHRRARIRVPNRKVHAIMHVVVENQIARGEEIPVQRTAIRLMQEGLDRHDAIHAIASVLIGHMAELQHAPSEAPDVKQPYFAELEHLTAKSWRQSG